MTRGLEQRLEAYAIAVAAAAKELAEYQRQYPAKYRRIAFTSELRPLDRLRRTEDEGEAAA